MYGLRALKSSWRHLVRHYTTWNLKPETQQLFTDAFFAPQNEAEYALHAFLRNFDYYDKNGKKVSKKKLDALRKEYKAASKNTTGTAKRIGSYKGGNGEDDGEDGEDDADSVPPTSKWDGKRAKKSGLPIDPKITSKSVTQLFSITNELPKELLQLVEEVPSCTDAIAEYTTVRAAIVNAAAEADDQPPQPKNSFLWALCSVIEAESHKQSVPQRRGTPELATVVLANYLIRHVLKMDNDEYRYVPFQFVVSLADGFLVSQPDRTVFKGRKAVCFFDVKKTVLHDRYGNAQSLGEALAVSMYNMDRGFPPRIIPQLRMYGQYLSVSLYYFTTEYMKAFRNRQANANTHGAFAYHMTWKGSQRGLDLFVKRERELAFKVLLAVRKVVEDPSPAHHPLFSGVNEIVEDPSGGQQPRLDMENGDDVSTH